ncbi:hypothetical protein R6Q57_005405 [Mikania cordata]
MVHIFDELIVFEILTRVPARTVGCSKCVSKKWKALLLTPQFVKIHCSRSLSASNQRVVLVDDLTCSMHPINFQSSGHGPGTILYFPFNKVTIYSHLDALLCVHLNHTSELALWNPVTGAYKLLPTHDLHGFFEHNADAVGLYIDASDDYKVLHIKITNRGEPYVIETNRKPFECFHASNRFRSFQGAMFVETILSPTL